MSAAAHANEAVVDTDLRCREEDDGIREGSRRQRGLEGAEVRLGQLDEQVGHGLERQGGTFGRRDAAIAPRQFHQFVIERQTLRQARLFGPSQRHDVQLDREGEGQRQRLLDRRSAAALTDAGA